MAKYSKGIVKGNTMTKALGRVVGLVLSLYVFDKVLSSIWGTVNTSVYFATAITFVENLLPVMGILGAFEIIYSALRSSGLV